MAQCFRGSVWGPALAVVVVTGSFFSLAALSSGLAAEESSSKSSRSPRAASTAKTQGEGGELARLEEKLDEIIANQQTILGKFDAIMEELRIIKVRATLHGS